jgi:hypothetical protein
VIVESNSHVYKATVGVKGNNSTADIYSFSCTVVCRGACVGSYTKFSV